MHTSNLLLLAMILICADHAFAENQIDEISARIRKTQSLYCGLTFDFNSSIQYNNASTVEQFNVYMLKFGALKDLRRAHRKWMVYPNSSSDAKIEFFYASQDSGSVMFKAEVVKEGASHGGVVFADVQNSQLTPNLFDQSLLSTPFGISYLQDPLGNFESSAMQSAEVTKVSSSLLEVRTENKAAGVSYFTKIDTNNWMVVYSRIQSSTEKLAEWRFDKILMTSSGVPYPKSGVYFQKGYGGEGGVPTVEYAFEVTDVYPIKQSQLDPWYPDFRPGTAVSNQSDGSKWFVPHDKIELQEAMLQAAKARGAAPSARFNWTLPTFFLLLASVMLTLAIRRGLRVFKK